MPYDFPPGGWYWRRRWHGDRDGTWAWVLDRDAPAWKREFAGLHEEGDEEESHPQHLLDLMIGPTGGAPRVATEIAEKMIAGKTGSAKSLRLPKGYPTITEMMETMGGKQMQKMINSEMAKKMKQTRMSSSKLMPDGAWDSMSTIRMTAWNFSLPWTAEAKAHPEAASKASGTGTLSSGAGSKHVHGSVSATSEMQSKVANLRISELDARNKRLKTSLGPRSKLPKPSGFRPSSFLYSNDQIGMMHLKNQISMRSLGGSPSERIRSSSNGGGDHQHPALPDHLPPSEKTDMPSLCPSTADEPMPCKTATVSTKARAMENPGSADDQQSIHKPRRQYFVPGHQPYLPLREPSDFKHRICSIKSLSLAMALQMMMLASMANHICRKASAIGRSLMRSNGRATLRTRRSGLGRGIEYVFMNVPKYIIAILYMIQNADALGSETYHITVKETVTNRMNRYDVWDFVILIFTVVAVEVLKDMLKDIIMSGLSKVFVGLKPKKPKCILQGCTQDTADGIDRETNQPYLACCPEHYRKYLMKFLELSMITHHVDDVYTCGAATSSTVTAAQALNAAHVNNAVNEHENLMHDHQMAMEMQMNEMQNVGRRRAYPTFENRKHRFEHTERPEKHYEMRNGKLVEVPIVTRVNDGPMAPPVAPMSAAAPVVVTKPVTELNANSSLDDMRSVIKAHGMQITTAGSGRTKQAIYEEITAYFAAQKRR